MSKKEEEKKQDELKNVENVLTVTEVFIEKHQKQILTGVGVVVLIVLAILSFKNFYLEPRENNAKASLYKAETLFAVDSFKVALEGTPNIEGFKNIASHYSMTASGNLAYAYAGICYYKLGQYDNAIKYLSQYDGDDNYFAASVVGLIGDAYAEKGETSKAIDYFKKAAGFDNNVIAPFYLKKAGIVYESNNQQDKALDCYQTIKDKYPKSNEAADIDKYIARSEKN